MWAVDTRIANYRIVAHLSTNDSVSSYAAERLGAGGFRRPVTLVALHVQLAGGAKFAKDFTEAASLFGHLPEDRFLPVEDFGVFEARFYCVTPHCSAWSLARFLEAAALAGEPLSMAAFYFLTFAVADALAALESVGRSNEGLRTFHGDVSPSTVLVSAGGRIRLRMPSVTLSEEGGSNGRNALQTRAPEQRRGDRGDPCADVFALGVLLWSLANRKGSEACRCDAGVRELVMRALSVEPGARPCSPARFRDELVGRVGDQITSGEATLRAAAGKLASRGVLQVTTGDVSSELEPTTALLRREDRGSVKPMIADNLYVLPPRRGSLRKVHRSSPDLISQLSERNAVDARDDTRDAGVAYLRVVGTAKSLVLIHGRDRWVIGRAAAGDLVLTDPDVSREHCEVIRRPDGSYTVYDLGSKNGVYVNGKRIDERPLVPGDEVRVGNTCLSLQASGKP